MLPFEIDDIDGDPDGYLEEIEVDNTYAIRGVINIARGGYAFVKTRHGSSPDVFIPAHLIGGAVSGDTVRVIVVSDGYLRIEGKVDSVITRGTGRFVGTVYADQEGMAALNCFKRVPGRKVLFTGDVPPVGSFCVSEVVYWPEIPSDSIFVVCKDFCENAADPENAVKVITLEFDLPDVFSQAATEAANVVPQVVEDAVLMNRVDLRHLLFITIDGETSRDFDDAVYIEAHTDGWKLFVAIADVSHYVEKSSVLDQEAYLRGASVYFPDRCLPMLPESLSNGICSLNEGVDRLVLVCEMVIGGNGDVVSSRFYNSVITSRKRMTYLQVNEVLGAQTDDSSLICADIKQMLSIMDVCWRALYSKRVLRGALDFDRTDRVFTTDVNGKQTVDTYSRGCSHRLIEEFMLAANESAAEFMCTACGRALLRVHGAPDYAKIVSLVRTIKILGLDFPKRQYDCAALLLKDVISLAHCDKRRDLIITEALKSMKKAEYAIGTGFADSRHFSLQTDRYTHFTSPIRRYPDIVVHRAIKSIIAGNMPEFDGLVDVAEHATGREVLATSAERAMDKRFQVDMLASRIGAVFEGVVTAVTKRGVYVVFGEMQSDGLIRSDDMGAHWEILSDDSGPTPLLTSVTVRILEVDAVKRSIYLGIVRWEEMYANSTKAKLLSGERDDSEISRFGN